MENYKSPVYKVIAVPVEKIIANSYNPNIVAPEEMKLLELSIWEDGYTMPCVCYYRKESDTYEIVDGFHRYMVMKTSQNASRIRNRQGHIGKDGLDDKAQPGKGNTFGRADERNRL